MKVLFFIRSMVVGGSQRQLAMLARGLAARGHDVAVVVFYTGSEIDVFRHDTSVRVVSLSKSGRWDALGPLLRLRRVLATERPDVLYAFQPTQSALAALLLPFGQSTKLVFGVRAAGMEVDRYDSLSALTYRLEVWLSRRADLIIANGRAVRADAIRRGMPGARIAVVPNGIDTQAMRPDPAAGRAQRHAWGLSEEALVIGCVARFDPMKDHATFLAAAAGFARAHPDARFVCIGGGPAAYRDKIKAVARSLGVDRSLIWAGEMDNLRAVYNAFDIATLASAFGEGFPNVIGEAMACGIPVAATDVGDARLIVGELGEVVPPRQPDLLCAAWERLRQRLAQDASFRDAMRHAIVTSYGVDAMVERTAQALSLLVAGRATEEIAR
ncbi:MAG TPA: glycosyltransferase [Xanthobacteraceae bacterium]|jgi:glycosyltransferase involved in cell wall biosynthesis